MLALTSALDGAQDSSDAKLLKIFSSSSPRTGRCLNVPPWDDGSDESDILAAFVFEG